MKKIILILFVIFNFSGLFTIVNASCTCECVNGKIEPLCTDALEATPICGMEVCPIPPPSAQPVLPPMLPPLGSSKCEEKQVLNRDTNQYEWKVICR